MKTKTYIDKSEWDEGPWQEEPDLAYWIDETTGFHCAVVRNQYGGSLCGYVGIPNWSEFATRRHSLDEGVHGGITYSAYSCPVDFTKHPEVFHSVSLIYPPEFWFGFDCAHAWDLMPAKTLHPSYMDTQATYRSFDYVLDQIRSMVTQLHVIQLDEGVT